MAHRGANTIVARITASDDYDIFSFRIDVATVLEFGIQERLGVELV